MDRFDGLKVTVMGLGRFGGGVGVVRWLAARGADVLVTDLADRESLGEPLARIGDLVERGRVTLRLGEHNVSDFTTCGLVVANPAVPKPWEDRFLRAARAAGVPITTEIGLAVERLPDRRRAIGVTGTAGKSTTSAMIHHVLSALAPAGSLLGGNIGGSLLEALDDAPGPRRWVVLELSSFMLHWLGPWSPGIAVVTNLSANHLDWHGTLGHYRASKQALLDGQRPGDAAVLGPGVADWPTREGVERVGVGEGVGGLAVPGGHNAQNAAVAAAACRIALARDGARGSGQAGRPSHAIEEVLRTFAGLPHRLEAVGARRGRLFYNDSKSTTPEATVLAVRAFDDPPGPGAGRVHLIAGGYDRKSDLSPIAALAGRLRGLYAIGATGPWIADRGGPAAHRCGTLEAAVAAAWARSGPGDVILLSPGCASWDQFTNYEARGEAFRRLASSLPDS
ncbi:MAG: UDP-N-acetylmuramoyl-L-alanine--D-glutamate ligase [Phycisphaerae bacterium]|nr:UDP-N-acetylmuramoyl-L-alanine--D-glutamate ligase [Phycisphaerae bacterium]